MEREHSKCQDKAHANAAPDLPEMQGKNEITIEQTAGNIQQTTMTTTLLRCTTTATTTTAASAASAASAATTTWTRQRVDSCRGRYGERHRRAATAYDCFVLGDLTRSLCVGAFHDVEVFGRC